MRENMGIYRGKRKDTGEWVEGNLIESDNSHYPMVLIGHVITSRDKHTNALSFDGFDLCEVDPSTVGQYTGLRDKNGKRIFEGDMVSTDIERPYLIVEFRDGCFMFNCNDGGEDYYDIMLPILKDPQSVYKYGEVIGDIHDNPELLEVSEND